MKREYIYLASPYSHPDAAVREARFKAACKKAAQYVTAGKAVFCPIAHSHPMVEFMAPENVMNFDLWMKADLPLVRYASELHVLMLDGWITSRGVQREISYADEVGIPVYRIQP